MLVYIIIGLPGSGKTHYGKALSIKTGLPFFDDCATDIEVSDAFEQSIASGQSCIVADPGFCIDAVKQKLLDKLNESPTPVFREFIYFANDPDTCAKNVTNRVDGREVSKRFAHSLAVWYTVPKDVTPIPCYKGM